MWLKLKKKNVQFMFCNMFLFKYPIDSTREGSRVIFLRRSNVIRTWSSVSNGNSDDFKI